jgi:ATP-binding cassette subfamily C (CFTR/MRP) protein 4
MATGGDGREAPEAEGGAAAPPAAPLRPAPALEGASVVSRLLFTWAYPLLKLGRTRPLLESDLPALLEADTSAYNRRYFEELWEGEKERTRARTGRWKGPASAAVPAAAPPLIPRLDRAVFVDYFRQTWDAQAWLVLSMAARLGQSLSLGLLIEQFSAGSDARMGYAWAGCLVGTGLVFLVAKQSQFFATIRKGMTMRLGLLAAIYSKSLRLGASSIPSGRVVNLASNDVERYQTASALVVYFIYAPLEAAVVLAVGITVVGGAFAAGFGLLLLFLPVQFHLARRFASLRSGTATVTDGRVGLVGQAVQGCRVMKMHGWEGSFGERIAEVRAQEMGRIVAASRYRSINEAIQFSYAAVVAAVTFSVHVWAGGELTSRMVFTAFSLIYILQMSLVKIFSQSVMYLSECYVSSRRIQTFLETPELRRPGRRSGTGRGGGGDGSEGPVPLITLSGATCYWNSWSATESSSSIVPTLDPETAESSRDESAGSIFEFAEGVATKGPALRGIDLTLQSGQIYCVIGPVGAGKSAMLKCLAGELPLTSGTMERRPSSSKFISYSQQDPWILNGTVRENIVFGLPDDEEWYVKVVESCGLSVDLLEFPSGDATVVGDRGVQCSGGQRARIGLARALYRDADLVLLDDPLSAVDSKVGRLIFYSAIMELCVKRGKCVVLATHQHQFVGDAKCVLIMDGEVRCQGSYTSCVAASNGKLTASFHTSHKQIEQVPEPSNSASRETPGSRDERPIHDGERRASLAIVKESRQTGVIKLRTWKNYAKAMGSLWIGLLLFVLFVVTQVSALVVIVYMGKWAEQPLEQQRSSHWNGLVFGLLGALMLLSFVRARLTFYYCLKASQHLHDKMTASVLHSKVLFFDTNPLGRILNRFAADVGIVDDQLPLTLVDFLVGIFITFGTIATTAVSLPMTLVVIPPLLWYFIKLRKIFTTNSRELKRLEGVARSPIYAMVSEALSGVATMRANDATDYFLKKFESIHDQHGRAYFAFIGGSRWFAFKLDFIAYLLLSITSLIAVLFHDQGWFNISPAVLGLTLSLLMQMATGNFPFVVRLSAEVVNQMISVERMDEFGNLPPEAPLEMEFDNECREWPKEPSISVSNLTVRYRPKLPPALSGVSFHIGSGKRVGVVGRTGSGKSSLVQALFRLLEAEKGSIVIGGVDVSKLGLHKLRQNISVIPQSPVLFGGTSVRFNLDPVDAYTDDEIRDALRDVQMLHVIEEFPEGILSIVDESGSNFSVGQRQLLCLARAILSKSKILVLDEASANIDRRTDALLQATVTTSFKGATILTVAHRLETIIDHDAVLVLGGGKVLEFGVPSELLKMDGHFAGMVASTGHQHADFLRESIKSK